MPSASVEGLAALDVGASTGGFTDCLLRRGHGGLRVDVSYGRVPGSCETTRGSSVQRTSIRTSGAWGRRTVDIATIDTSFISLRLVVPPALVRQGRQPSPGLVKPSSKQERPRWERGRRPRPLGACRVLEELKTFFAEQGLSVKGVLQSPLANLRKP